MRYKIALFCILSFFTISVFSESLMSIQRDARGITDMKSSESQRVSLRGVIRSMGEHTALGVTKIEFVEENTGRIYSLTNADELLDLHVKEEKDLLVVLSAKKNPRFLFWGGGLKVISFELLDTQASAPHISQRNEVSVERFYRNR